MSDVVVLAFTVSIYGTVLHNLSCTSLRRRGKYFRKYTYITYETLSLRRRRRATIPFPSTLTVDEDDRRSHHPRPPPRRRVIKLRLEVLLDLLRRVLLQHEVREQDGERGVHARLGRHARRVVRPEPAVLSNREQRAVVVGGVVGYVPGHPKRDGDARRRNRHHGA
eukprot:31362-Pelagococcus_subviridis.AAC.1